MINIAPAFFSPCAACHWHLFDAVVAQLAYHHFLTFSIRTLQPFANGFVLRPIGAFFSWGFFSWDFFSWGSFSWDLFQLGLFPVGLFLLGLFHLHSNSDSIVTFTCTRLV